MNALQQLENTPEILRAMMEGLSEEEVLWKPAPNRFSIAEVLEHLSHTEGHCFRLRLELSTEQDGAPWESYDPEPYIAAGQYSGRDPEDSFAHFEERREDNLEFMRLLPEGWQERTGVLPDLGTVALGELVNEWAFHDLGHIRQIAEIIRARCFHPHRGPYQKDSPVNP